MRRSRIRTCLVAVFALALVIGACGGDDDDDTSSPADGTEADGAAAEGGSLVIARTSPLASWDPEAELGIEAFTTLPAVMEPLLRVSDDASSLVPGLASEWAYNEDNTELTFTLQEGAGFSNGDPMTSADVKFSVEQWKAGPTYGEAFFTSIETVEAPDEQTVVLKLNTPDTYLVNILSQLPALVFPLDYAGMTREEYFEKPIGAGPFMIGSETKGEEIVLVPNPHYYKADAPKLDEVIIRTVTDETQRVLQFEEGEFDIVNDVAVDRSDQYSEDDLVVVDNSSLLIYAAMNQAVPPFDDVNFRRALSLATDRESIVEGLFSGYGSPPKKFLPPNVGNAADPTEGTWDFDLDAAAAALAQSSYASGTTLTLLTADSHSVSQGLAEALAQQWGEIGVTVDVQVVDRATVLDMTHAGDFQILIQENLSITPSQGDALSYAAFTEIYFQAADAANYQETYFAFSASGDDAERDTLVSDLENWNLENVPGFPIAALPMMWAAADDVEGFVPNGLGFYYLDTISVG